MGIELTKNHFKVKFNEPTSYAFHGLVLNFFVKEVLSKSHDDINSQLYFRLFRVGLIGDILYKAGLKNIKDEKHTVNNEMLAGLFESYLLLARPIYEYLLTFLNKKCNVKEKTFIKFLKQVKNGGYKKINKKFRSHLNNKIFTNLKSLRDSVAHHTPQLMVYVKDHIYYVDGNVYYDDGTKERIDESLRLLILGYTTSLLLLMSYIAQEITGKSLREQLKERDKEKGQSSASVS